MKTQRFQLLSRAGKRTNETNERSRIVYAYKQQRKLYTWTTIECARWRAQRLHCQRKIIIFLIFGVIFSCRRRRPFSLRSTMVRFIILHSHFAILIVLLCFSITKTPFSMGASVFAQKYLFICNGSSAVNAQTEDVCDSLKTVC